MKNLLFTLFCCFCLFHFYGKELHWEGIGGFKCCKHNNYLLTRYDVEEASDLSHSAAIRQITELLDATLKKYVFKFSLHFSSDNDPINCSLTNRQRLEIKSYNLSPNDMKLVKGKTVDYKWKFKIPTEFLLSTQFTLIHQINAVDEDDGYLFFTLIPSKKVSLDVLEFISDPSTKLDTQANNKVKIVDNSMLSQYLNQWAEVTETIKFDTNGLYSIVIKRLFDNQILMNYTNNNILTIRSDNSCVIPKWEIYRSIATIDSLGDEVVLFTDFKITEIVSLTTNLYESKIMSNNILIATNVNNSVEI